MLLATWNLNSIRVREARLLAWLERHRPDLLCLQELKVPERDFPSAAIEALGYHRAVLGQPGYNGVAILSRAPIDEVRLGMDDGVEDPQARLIAARVGGVWVLSAYFPNGGELGSEKWDFKLAWMGRLRAHLDRHYDPAAPLALCGDFNVAPEDRDVARPADWAESVLCHPDARAALEAIRGWGLVDVFRKHRPEAGLYSWWDYRNQAFPRDDGLRIDHIFASPALAACSQAAAIDRGEREGAQPSDHVPVSAAFAWSLEAGGAVDGEVEGDAAGAIPALPGEIPPGAHAPGDGDGTAGIGRKASGGRGSAGARPKASPASTASPASPASASSAGPIASPGLGSEGRPKLVLVDGHSVAYRAFYGLPLYDRRGKASFSTAQGEHTNAVYGFANMLIKAWIDERPDYIAVAFDLGRTFRDDLFEAYKGTREKMPEELVPQIDRIMQLVEAFDLPAVTAEGFEADDILGTLARRGAADGLEVLVVTGDSDAFQLIGPHIRVLAPGRLWSDTAVWDEAAVRERYGLAPDQLIDLKALMGDTSDNIPGVRGIGEKTALALLSAHPSVEAIYEALDEVRPDRAKNALEAGRDMAFLSKRLVTIRSDVPLDLDWEACAAHSYDRAKVEALFDQLEFRSIRNRLPPGGGPAGAEGGPLAAGSPASAAGTGGGTTQAAGAARPSGPGGQMALFEVGAPPGSNPDAAAAPAREPITRTTVVQDDAALAALVAALGRAEVIAFDTETTATDPLRARLVGLSFAVEPGAGWYVPVGHASEEPQLAVETVLRALAPVLADPGRPKVGHNAKYDMAVLRQAGLEVAGLGFDTMLAEFLIDPSSKLGLKLLARSRLGLEMTEIASLLGSGRQQITMDQVPVADAAAYAAADADVTLRLMRDQEPRLEALGLRRLLDEIDLPLVPVLIDMELHGVLLDLDLLAAMSKRLAERLAAIEDEVYRLVGTPFNLNSPIQLGEILFDHLGLKSAGQRKTATGRVSVAAEVLEGLRGQHPVIDLILEQRQLSKLKSTYLDALPKLVDPRTGRVHTSFNQVGAVSGRLASQEPNLQNIPVRSELGREVRRAFIVPPGWKLIAADYSQVELRIVAHLCQDPGLREAFAAGQDIHRATAARVLGIAPEAVSADQRRFAKSLNFGLLYGMGAQSLAQQTGTTMKEATRFMEAYFAGFPNVKRYIEDTKRLAREQGYVETLFGRRRYFPVLRSETRDTRTRVLQAAAEREAINHPMQGTAADIIKIAMCRIHRLLGAEGLRARLLLQVHDELLLEAPEAEVEAVATLLRREMEGACTLDPPLRVDVGVGSNWDEVK